MKHILNFSFRGNKYLTKVFFQMQYLILKGKNLADADVVAISSCISKIKKLSGIEEIILASNSRVKIPLLVEIVKKMDEPVIMETNYDYLLFLLINNYFYYFSLHFLNNYFLLKKTYCAEFIHEKSGCRIEPEPEP